MYYKIFNNQGTWEVVFIHHESDESKYNQSCFLTDGWGDPMVFSSVEEARKMTKTLNG